MALSQLARAPQHLDRIEADDIINVREAAALYRCAPKLIYRLVDEGKLPHLRIPGTRMIRFSRRRLLAGLETTSE